MTETCLAHVLDDLTFQPDLPALMKRLRVKDGSAHLDELVDLLAEGAALAHPRALYMVAYITERSEERVCLGEVCFKSRVLCVNLEKNYRVFPYLATCGQELQVWADSQDDLVHSYWAEAVKEQALYTAIHAVQEHMQNHYQPGDTASMSPGSLADWPIQQQQPLFQLFGPYSAAIGVQLTESMLMMPNKSVSGIRFPSENHFESCQLCPREGCPGRRAVYDPDFYDAKYCVHAG